MNMKMTCYTDCFLVRNGLYQCLCLFSGKSGRSVALHLDAAYFIEHHHIGRHEDILVIKEAAHVRVSRQCRRLQTGKLLAIICRKIQVAPDLALFHEVLRLIDIDTMISDGAFSRGIDLAREPAACRAVGIVHHGDRRLAQDTVQVHEIVQDRVGETGQEEYHHHSGIGENQLQLMGENSPEVLQPLLYVTIFLS